MKLFLCLAVSHDVMYPECSYEHVSRCISSHSKRGASVQLHAVSYVTKERATGTYYRCDDTKTDVEAVDTRKILLLLI
jgi:hypothetical protein